MIPPGVRVPQRALLAVIAAYNPELTNKELAKVTGYSRTTLSDPDMQRLLIKARAIGRTEFEHPIDPEGT